MRRPLAAEIAEELRRQIFSGELPQGSRIDQDALASGHDASRIPVREALIALDQEGLVETVPRRGSYVAVYSPEDVLDQYEICGLVAGMAAARAAALLDERAVTDLATANRRFVAARSAAERRRCNFEFHRIVNTPASGRLRATLRLVDGGLPSHHYALSREWTATAAEQHEAIAEAIAAREPDAARAAMLGHFMAAGHEAVEALERRGFWPQPAVVAT